MSSPARRPSRSSSRPTVMRRLAHSWTRWRQKRRTRQLVKQQERMDLLVRPLLMEALTPVAEAMQRLDLQQQQTRALLEQLVLKEQATPPETKELLLEVLQTLQPPPEVEIAQRLGLPLRQSSSPGSVS